ncbi:MBOAT family O-acyltransferase [Zavarzinella formosa]|uniref:MBOAT family O-acyltransferase n=1 Tax=Zavarzinella formosa TaxID=360055 RepID=UPI0002E93492|nr:MBOAT family O-acyltransferase [Zavarzinella formosa]
MLFHTQAYLIFFLIVWAVYWFSPWKGGRVYWLLGASIYFYATWNKWLALLVFGTATIDYLLALGIERAGSRRRGRALVGVSLAVNLGVLCYFKYRGFFLDSLREGLAAVGVTTSIPHLEMLVPFGISFYTFEAISYTIDVYAGRVRAERNLPNFLLFILFFPHLVAGPIVRAKDFLTQVKRPKRWSWPRAFVGLQLIVLGLFKKLAIADCMAIYSDPVFDPKQNIDALSSGSVWLGVIAFAIRIYCDFSGYSDMALGSAHLLGYKLTVNFRMPYLSANVSEFWRRWHISLSSWLRDYLFIPLGGSRGTRWQTARNLLITMTLGGLWHGACFSFIIWGLLHGIFLIVHRVFRDWISDKPRLDALLRTSAGYFVRMGLTLFCVLISWVFFQDSLSRAMLVLRKMFVPVAGSALPLEPLRLWVTVGLLVIAHMATAWGLWKRAVGRMPPVIIGTACSVAFILAQMLAPETSKPFVYFQF